MAMFVMPDRGTCMRVAASSLYDGLPLVCPLGRNTTLRNHKIFYGYWIVAACFFCALVGNGSCMGIFAVFVKVLHEKMGWSRTEIMAGFTIYVVISAIVSPMVGRIVDRRGAPLVIGSGGLLSASGLILLGLMTRLWHFYLGHALIGIGAVAAGPVVLSYVVSRWFVRRRGMAMGIMSMGMAASGLVFGPLIAVVAIPLLGPGNAYLAMALINLLVFTSLSMFVIKTTPGEMGLRPDGITIEVSHIEDARSRARSRNSGTRDLSLRQAMATPAFWIMGIYLIFHHVYVGVLQNVYAYLSDMGFSAGIGSLVIGLSSLAASGGMFLFGWLSDRMKAKHAAALGLGLIVAGIAILFNIRPSSSIQWLWLYSLLIGLGMGCWLPTMSALISSTFGMISYGAIFGIMSFFQYSGASIGPLLTGYLYDTTHSYRPAFAVIMMFELIAMVLVLANRPPKR